MRGRQHSGARGEPKLPGCGRPRSQKCPHCPLLVGSARNHRTQGAYHSAHFVSADADTHTCITHVWLSQDNMKALVQFCRVDILTYRTACIAHCAAEVLWRSQASHIIMGPGIARSCCHLERPVLLLHFYCGQRMQFRCVSQLAGNVLEFHRPS